jgi:hypothetical protein
MSKTIIPVTQAFPFTNTFSINDIWVYIDYKPITDMSYHDGIDEILKLDTRPITIEEKIYGDFVEINIKYLYTDGNIWVRLSHIPLEKFTEFPYKSINVSNIILDYDDENIYVYADDTIMYKLCYK